MIEEDGRTLENIMAEQTKVSHTLDADVITEVEAVAEAERRSRSNMIEVLCLEALAARRETAA